MAKKTREQLKTFYSKEGIHKITAVKKGLLNNTLDSFPELFAIVAKSNLQILLGTEFYAFDRKIKDPGRFNLNEIETMADFFKIDYDDMYKFVRKNMINSQKKGKNKQRKA